MNEINLKNIVESQIDTFLYAGNVAIELRNKGLTKEIKSDGAVGLGPDDDMPDDMDF